jgi:F-type H+-transporting ATPase subunit c
MEGLNFVGAGLIVIGAALGIGRIGGSAMDAIARQPEASGKIQTAMLIAAALMKELVSLHYLLLKIQKTIVTTVGCNYCFIIKLNIIIDT